MDQISKNLDKLQMDFAQMNGELMSSLFHEQTKRFPNALASSPVSYDLDLLPECSRRAFKSYPSTSKVFLPEPQALPVHLDQLALRRKSVRAFSGQPALLEQVATQLSLSYRIKKEAATRPIPSGGALYPLELYVTSLNIQETDAGLYHYHPALHALELLSDDPPFPRLQQCLLPGSLPEGTAYIFCICGVLPRNSFKYGELGYRLMLLEAGHLAQNILLVATAQNLAAIPICGFYDDRMHDYLEVDGLDELCLYLIMVGQPNVF
ncbi:MAG: SagB/ThcOx family dehydrogenase [Chloroflexota bacterium]